MLSLNVSSYHSSVGKLLRQIRKDVPVISQILAINLPPRVPIVSCPDQERRSGHETRVPMLCVLNTLHAKNIILSHNFIRL